MAQDFISSMLYSCGHFKDYGMGSWCMSNYPCPECEAKGVKDVSFTSFDPAYTHLHYDKTFWGKRKNTGTWKRVDRPADWKERLEKSLQKFHRVEPWFGAWPPEIKR